MRETLRIVGLGLLVACSAGGLASCRSSKNARTTPLDGGSGGSPGADAGASDSPGGNGGATGSDGAAAGEGLGGRTGTGETSGVGGATGAGGVLGSGAAQGSGGVPGSGGAPATGGLQGTDAATLTSGALGVGGIPGAGGMPGSGGLPADGAIATSGATGSGGRTATGGTIGTGGSAASGGATATGGSVAAGGSAASGGTTATGGSVAAGGTTGAGGTLCGVGSPPSGGTSNCSSNATGAYGSYQWMLWENGSGGCLITYPNADAAFSATWNNSGDFLARVGLKWDATKTYDQLGTITAQFAETKTGTGGGYSYIGIYGWSVSPCVEFYIVEDSFNTMPIKPGSGVNMGTAVIDGGPYTFYTLPMTGTGTSLCSGSMSWTQIWSVRQTARQCGQISVTNHINEWRKLGLTPGLMAEAMLFVEAGGGSGRIDFTTASMTAR